MAVSALESKAHELLGQLNPGKLAAVVHLLEVMVHDDEPLSDPEPVSDEDRRRIRDGQAFFADGKGIPMEEVLAEFGMKPEDFPLTK